VVDSIDRLLNMILLELTVAAAVNVLVEKEEEEEAAIMPAEWNAPVQARITRVYIQSLAPADSYL
jgi:hypothetical protein